MNRKEEMLTRVHSDERARWHKMKKEIGHSDYDKAWQGGRVSGLAIALEIAALCASAAPEDKQK